LEEVPMLAPGDYLIKPTTVPPSSPTPIMTPALVPALAKSIYTGQQPKPPAVEPEPTGFRRFLLTLLRALGAVHT